MTTLHYFAYGSNLHPLRLQQRVPSAALVGVAELGSFRLVFHKRGQDDSAKCSLLASASETDRVYGAIYTMSAGHKGLLDRFEGLGNGYRDQVLQIRFLGRDYPCLTYIAQETHIVDDLRPYHWYKELVLNGARFHQFPENYISTIECIESVDDPQTERMREYQRLLDKMTAY